MQQIQDFHLARIIEEGGGLVEEDDGRLLRQGFGDHHFLTFAVTQGLDHAVAERNDAHQRQCIVHLAAVFGRQPAPEAGVRAAPHPHQFGDRHVLEIGLFRQDHPDDGSQFFFAILPQRLAQDGDLAGQGREKTREGAQQRGLAGAVFTQQTGQLSAVDGLGDAFGHNLDRMLAGITDGEPRKTDGFLAVHSPVSSFRRLKSTTATTGAPIRAVTELTGSAPSKPGIRAMRLQSKASAAPASREAGISTR